MPRSAEGDAIIFFEATGTPPAKSNDTPIFSPSERAKRGVITLIQQ